jgi:hypothetical protein
MAGLMVVNVVTEHHYQQNADHVILNAISQQKHTISNKMNQWPRQILVYLPRKSAITSSKFNAGGIRTQTLLQMQRNG